jgi:hypothetical protein
MSATAASAASAASVHPPSNGQVTATTALVHRKLPEHGTLLSIIQTRVRDDANVIAEFLPFGNDVFQLWNSGMLGACYAGKPKNPTLGTVFRTESPLCPGVHFQHRMYGTFASLHASLRSVPAGVIDSVMVNPEEMKNIGQWLMGKVNPKDQPVNLVNPFRTMDPFMTIHHSAQYNAELLGLDEPECPLGIPASLDTIDDFKRWFNSVLTPDEKKQNLSGTAKAATLEFPYNPPITKTKALRLHQLVSIALARFSLRAMSLVLTAEPTRLPNGSMATLAVRMATPQLIATAAQNGPVATKLVVITHRMAADLIVEPHVTGISIPSDKDEKLAHPSAAFVRETLAAIGSDNFKRLFGAGLPHGMRSESARSFVLKYFMRAIRQKRLHVDVIPYLTELRVRVPAMVQSRFAHEYRRNVLTPEEVGKGVEVEQIPNDFTVQLATEHPVFFMVFAVGKDSATSLVHDEAKLSDAEYYHVYLSPWLLAEMQVTQHSKHPLPGLLMAHRLNDLLPEFDAAPQPWSHFGAIVVHDVNGKPRRVGFLPKETDLRVCAEWSKQFGRPAPPDATEQTLADQIVIQRLNDRKGIASKPPTPQLAPAAAPAAAPKPPTPQLAPAPAPIALCDISEGVVAATAAPAPVPEPVAKPSGRARILSVANVPAAAAAAATKSPAKPARPSLMDPALAALEAAEQAARQQTLADEKEEKAKAAALEAAEAKKAAKAAKAAKAKPKGKEKRAAEESSSSATADETARPAKRLRKTVEIESSSVTPQVPSDAAAHLQPTTTPNLSVLPAPAPAATPAVVASDAAQRLAAIHTIATASSSSSSSSVLTVFDCTTAFALEYQALQLKELMAIEKIKRQTATDLQKLVATLRPATATASMKID